MDTRHAPVSVSGGHARFPTRRSSNALRFAPKACPEKGFVRLDRTGAISDKHVFECPSLRAKVVRKKGFVRLDRTGGDFRTSLCSNDPRFAPKLSGKRALSGWTGQVAISGQACVRTTPASRRSLVRKKWLVRLGRTGAISGQECVRTTASLVRGAARVRLSAVGVRGEWRRGRRGRRAPANCGWAK